MRADVTTHSDEARTASPDLRSSTPVWWNPRLRRTLGWALLSTQCTSGQAWFWRIMGASELFNMSFMPGPQAGHAGVVLEPLSELTRLVSKNAARFQ